MTTGTLAGPRASRRPSPLRVGVARGVAETKAFFRERDALVFTFALPIVLLVIFGSIFHGELGDTGVDFRQYFVAGILAAGIMSTSLVNLGVNIATERDDGTLKRLVGTPMPRSAYFVGKVVVVLVTSIAEAAILLALGAAFYGLDLPSDPGRWLTFAWVFVLGVTASTLLGIVVSSLPRSGRSAGAVINLPFLVLQFISGVFFPFSQIPDAMQRVAEIFPLMWMCLGFRSVFLPDTFTALEPAHSWQHGVTALVLAGWCVAGLVLCMTTFRWLRRGER